jgi:outer membrane protein assembly factor BamB
VAPPPLFPFTTLWTAGLDEIADGPLATDGTRLFVSTRAGVQAFDAGGTLLWRQTGRVGHLAASQGLVLLREPDGTLSSLDPATGAPRWSTSTPIHGTLPPAIDGDHVYVAGNGIAAFDTGSGRSLWSFAGPPEVTAPPVGAGSRLLVGEGDGTLRARDRASGLSVWTFKTEGPLRAVPYVDASGRAFLGTTDRRFVAIGVENGKRLWQWKIGADVDSPAAVLGQRVLFTSYEGVLYSLNAGGGDLRWRAPLPSRPFSGPLLVGRSVLVACYETDILGFDGRSGTRLGGFKTSAEIQTAPLLAGDRLYIALRDRSVVAFRLQLTPEPSPSPSSSAKPSKP